MDFRGGLVSKPFKNILKEKKKKKKKKVKVPVHKDNYLAPISILEHILTKRNILHMKNFVDFFLKSLVNLKRKKVLISPT